MQPLNPWLQRLLVAWAASTVTTGTLLATAENRYRPKKPKKKRRSRPDGAARRPRPQALPGTVAKADAAEGSTPSLTWAEWFAAVQARGQRLLRFVSGQPPIGSVDDDGARLPDEVVTAGGQKVKVGKPTAKKAGARKRRAASTTRRRGRRQQRQATLFESAKESLRQVVKEEAQKAVDDTVEEAGLGKARDALKTASEAVGKTAATVAEKVKGSIPEDFDEKAKSAGRSLFSGAKRAMQKLGESLQALDDMTVAAPPPPSDHVDAVDTVDTVDTDSPPPVEALPTEAQVVDLLATMAMLDGATTPTTAPPAPTTTAPTTPAPTTTAPTTTAPEASPGTAGAAGTTGMQAPSAAIEGLELEGLAEKVGGGVQRLGAFLSGPGNPGYLGGRQPRRAVGDVVEARDAPSTPPDPPPSDDAGRG